MAALLFEIALRAYPAAFRARFGPSMREAFHDRWSHARSQGRVRASLGLAPLVSDVVSSGFRERLTPSWTPPPPTSESATMDHLAQDLRFAVRSLVRRPGFTAVALLTLALGIGATTAVFSVVDGVLLKPLPYADSGELAMVWTHDVSEPERFDGWQSLPDIQDLQALPVFDQLEGWQGGSWTLTDGDRPEQIDGARVTGGIFELFGVTPTAGRDLRREENTRDAPRVAVVSHRMWQERMGGRPDAVGSTIRLSETPYEVVGIGPEGFDFPAGSMIWTPYRHELSGCGRGCSVYRVVARLADGVSLQEAEAPMEALAAGLRETYPGTSIDVAFHGESLMSHTVGDVRTGLWVILSAVVLVLLVVCANVANLLLVRASTRGGEIAVRAAMGASRGRLVAQILTESLVLAAAGGGAGVVLSLGLLEGFRAVAPVSLPRMDEVGLNVEVLGFALVLTLGVGLLFGLSPAFHLAGDAAARRLTGGARSSRAGEGRSRSWLMGAEVALSLTLLIGAALFMKSLGQLYRVDLGFQGREVLRFSVSLPSARYDTLPELTQFYDRLEEGLRGLPGVTAVGSSYGVPLAGGNIAGGVQVEGRPEPEPGAYLSASIRPSTAGYFVAQGMHLVRGRGIEPTDRIDTEPVTVVNQRFVRENFPEEDPLGQRIRVGASFGWEVSDYWTVVGVVQDVRRSLKGEPSSAVYMPQSQFGPGFLRVHVAGRDVGGLVSAVRAEVAALDPNLAVTGLDTVREAIRDDAAPTRFYLLLVGIFAALAVVVASVGLYGVVAYLVSRRTREIGIRMALGARGPEIRGLVLREGLRPLVFGVAAGLALTFLGGRLVEGLLYGVQAFDPVVYAGVSAVIVGVSLVAMILPARRAVRIDPTEALRAEA